MELGEEERYAAAALFSLALHLTQVLPHRACCSASPSKCTVLCGRECYASASGNLVRAVCRRV
jgi:hypothetical protein